MFGDGTDPIGMPITVTGTKAAPMVPPPVTGPTEAATPAGTPVAAAPKKKHIWQDVLGAVGDAMLAQGGSKPMYAPKRQEYMLGEVMQGFDKDPVSTIKQVSKLDAALGERMLNNYQENEIRKDTAAYANMRVQRDDELKKREYDDKTLKVGYSMLRNPNIKNTYKKVLPAIKKYVEDRGGNPDELRLPEEYDEDIINSFLETTLTSKQDADIESNNNYRNKMLAIREARLAQQEALANSLISDRNTDNGRQAGDSAERGRHNQATEAISASKGKGGGGRIPAPKAATPATPSKYEEGRVYTDANGNKAKYSSGKWIPQ